MRQSARSSLLNCNDQLGVAGGNKGKSQIWLGLTTSSLADLNKDNGVYQGG